ncbi:MAG: glycosyltransferase family 2 protein [Rectinemataceae bacterium]
MKNTPNEAPDAIALSVVTVVRNDAAGLERTMASVAEQTRPGIEYIVVDGASTDGTLEAIRRRADLVDAWISEPDGGIYAAMNKGAAMASGDYVLFMNAGDRFYAAETVEKIFEPRPRTELLWGDCVIEKSGGGEEYDCARDVLRHLHRQMTVSHQSLFTRRSALLARPYDESLRIAADYDFLCERLLSGASWEYRALPVSRTDDRGVSARAFETSIGEKRRISLARFPEKRASILAYYAVLGLYMRAKLALGGIRGR